MPRHDLDRLSGRVRNCNTETRYRFDRPVIDSCLPRWFSFGATLFFSESTMAWMPSFVADFRPPSSWLFFSSASPFIGFVTKIFVAWVGPCCLYLARVALPLAIAERTIERSACVRSIPPDDALAFPRADRGLTHGDDRSHDPSDGTI